MNRIPPDRATPALLLTNNPGDATQAATQGWNIHTRLADGRAARLARIMAGARGALIWQGQDWTISLPLATRSEPKEQPDHGPRAATPTTAKAPSPRQPGTRADLLAQWSRITTAATAKANAGKGRTHA